MGSTFCPVAVGQFLYIQMMGDRGLNAARPGLALLAFLRDWYTNAGNKAMSSLYQCMLLLSSDFVRPYLFGNCNTSVPYHTPISLLPNQRTIIDQSTRSLLNEQKLINERVD